MRTIILPRLTLFAVITLLVIGSGSSPALAQHSGGHGGSHGGGGHSGGGHAGGGHVGGGHVSGGHSGGHVSVGHVGRRHISGGHVTVGHADGRHISTGHVSAGHVSAGHLGGGHVSVGHASAGHVGSFGHVGGHSAIHHGGHHPSHFVHHAGLHFYSYWSSRWSYPSYGRYARPAQATTIYQGPASQPSTRSRPGDGEPLRRDGEEADTYASPNGMYLSAPLVETDEAPEALPPLDEEDEPGEFDELPSTPHVHEAPN